MQRTSVPFDMGEALIRHKRQQQRMNKFGNGAIDIGGGVIVVPNSRYGAGGIQIRKAGRGGPRVTNTIGKGLQKCAGLEGKAFMECIDSIEGFRAPSSMKATRGMAKEIELKRRAESKYTLPERKELLRALTA